MRDVGAYIEGAPDQDLHDVQRVYLERGAFLIGEREGRIVAMGGFRPASDGYMPGFLDDLPDGAAELKRLRVDPAHQRRGHGQTLYEELERRAVAAGYTDFLLDTTPGQTGARRLFERNAFEEVHRESIPLDDGSFVMIFYHKALGSE